jgi:hypothetical protein
MDMACMPKRLISGAAPYQLQSGLFLIPPDLWAVVPTCSSCLEQPAVKGVRVCMTARHSPVFDLAPGISSLCVHLHGHTQVELRFHGGTHALYATDAVSSGTVACIR